jgi:copper(I)-binding protein
MRETAAGIPVGAHGGRLLQPGGYHVMLMSLDRELAPGDEIELTLTFSDGTTEAVTAPVKEFTEEEGHYHAPGTGEHSH